nr:MAG TPA: hypothetical protein [Caudoviricetes sp.]
MIKSKHVFSFKLNRIKFNCISDFLEHLLN